MATRVLLTIDTELTWRHFAGGAGWRENLALSCEPAGVGLRYQLDTLARHGLRACFFVDPMPALAYGLEPVRAMVAPILAAGQEIQLHLHSFWFDLEGQPPAVLQEAARFELTRFDRSGQRELIDAARNLLIEAGAPAPTAFRSGSFAANADTLGALRDLGIRIDSSHSGHDHPWPSALPLDDDLIDPVDFDGIIELPVTQIRQRDGGLRPAQITALSTQEMQAALRHAATHDHPLVNIVSHSFELATRDGRRANRIVTRRFERLCAFLSVHAATMPTVTTAEIAPVPARRRSEPLEARPARTLRRVVEQGLGHVIFERPGLGAALLAPPPIALAAFTWFGDVGL